MVKKLLSFLTLFSSLGTLVCCALPALLVSLGMGATLVSTLSAVPQLVWLSENKYAVFLFAGVMLLVSGLLRYFARDSACPIDPELAAACRTGKRVSTVLFWFSVAVYAVGAFFAFAAPILFFDE